MNLQVNLQVRQWLHALALCSVLLCLSAAYAGADPGSATLVPSAKDAAAVPAVSAASAPSTAVEANESFRSSEPTHAARHQVLVMLHMPAPHYRPDAAYGGRYGEAGQSARRRIAHELAQAHGLVVVNDWPMPALGLDCYVMEDPAGDSAEHLAEILSHDPRAEWVQPMSLFHSLGDAGSGHVTERTDGLDGAAVRRDSLYAVQPAAKFWHLEELHRVATGRNVRVAVIDSGVDDSHPDLLGQIALRENFVDDSDYVAEPHGTAVAGIIAALAGNGTGIEGVAPGARLLALRACWQRGMAPASCNSFTLGKAINFAILHDAQVINLSIGGPPDRLLQKLVEAAQQRGIKVVAAIDPQRPDGGFPASLPGVLAVAGQELAQAIGRNGMVPRGALLAPGRDIPTTAPGARWSFVSGSSYAAAHVSGMVALLTELRPRATALQMQEQLSLSSAIHAASAIDACATIGRITGTCPCSCAQANAPKS